MAPGPTKLRERLTQRIQALGPIPVADYMLACLADPDFGYYWTRDPLGAKGDFITAPEISQIFGELIGLWCLEVWRSMGSPAHFNLIELGPGRGTLMADVLRTARLMPDFVSAAHLHLVETSLALKAAQADTLRDAGKSPAWHVNLTSIPRGADIVLANEFLDALPVHQFVRRGDAWHERCVGLTEAGELTFMDAPQPTDTGTLPDFMQATASEGAIAETRPAVDTLAKELAVRADSHPLAALFIDYGHMRSATGDTLQALRAHKFADPLQDPGEADLTAHVDFEALARAARTHGLAACGPLTQGAFLFGLGLRQRCDQLLSANPTRAESIAAGADRLVNPAEMGELFKVMALTSKALPTPPPFTQNSREDVGAS